MPLRSRGVMTQEFFCMSKGEIRESRAARFLIGGPPLLFLLVFFVGPSLIMILTSFRFPGEFGGLAPLAAPAGSLDSEHGFTPEAYQFFFSDLLYA
jgi:spermidine/putrescine transport system permease protein